MLDGKNVKSTLLCASWTEPTPALRSNATLSTAYLHICKAPNKQKFQNLAIQHQTFSLVAVTEIFQKNNIFITNPDMCPDESCQVSETKTFFWIVANLQGREDFVDENLKVCS